MASEEKFGRYVLSIGPQGFEVRESLPPFIGWIYSLLGLSTEARVRVGAYTGGANDYSIAAIDDVIVRERRITGPEAKSPLPKRSSEVIMQGSGTRGSPPRFRFRSEAQAQRFANALRRSLVDSSNSESR